MKDLTSLRARSDLPPGMVATVACAKNRNEVVFIEAALLPGATGIVLTGSRGEEIHDQVRSAQSQVWSRANELGIHGRLFRRYGLHIHAPVSGDHAAAGLAIVVALVSVYTGSAALANVVITGGTTLTGLVLSVSALHERLEAARLAGFEKIIAPSVQQKEVAAWVNRESNGTSTVLVDSVEDALKATLPRMMKHLAALKASL